jgi:hypothetical protein
MRPMKTGSCFQMDPSLRRPRKQTVLLSPADMSILVLQTGEVKSRAEVGKLDDNDQ